MSSKAGSRQRNDERLFFYAATIMSLVFGAGLCFLLCAINNQENDRADGAATPW